MGERLDAEGDVATDSRSRPDMPRPSSDTDAQAGSDTNPTGAHCYGNAHPADRDVGSDRSSAQGTAASIADTAPNAHATATDRDDYSHDPTDRNTSGRFGRDGDTCADDRSGGNAFAHTGSCDPNAYSLACASGGHGSIRTDYDGTGTARAASPNIAAATASARSCDRDSATANHDGDATGHRHTVEPAIAYGSAERSSTTDYNGSTERSSTTGYR